MTSFQAYTAYFRIRYLGNLQYRTAAWAGLATQVVWGMMLILMFRAFYTSSPDAFPMTWQALVNYTWLQQSCLTLVAGWILDNDIFTSITDGSLVYEVLRPLDLYAWWFARNLALRAGRATLRFAPVLILAALLPPPFRMTLPTDLRAFALFLLSLVLALLLVVAYSMWVYIGGIYYQNPSGIRILSVSLADLLTGGLIPLPFMPRSIQALLEWTPFGVMQNLPFRIYSGDIQGAALISMLTRQVTWLLILVLTGHVAMRRVLKHVVIQGG